MPQIHQCIRPERFGNALETELGRFEFPIGDYDRLAHPAVMADDIKVATLASGFAPSFQDHVELHHNSLNTRMEVTNLARSHVKTKQTVPQTCETKRQ